MSAKNISGQAVDINLSAEIRKAFEAGETLAQFGVRIAKAHDVYVSGNAWNRVKNIMTGNTPMQRANARIKELEKQVASGSKKK